MYGWKVKRVSYSALFQMYTWFRYAVDTAQFVLSSYMCLFVCIRLMYTPNTVLYTIKCSICDPINDLQNSNTVIRSSSIWFVCVNIFIGILATCSRLLLSRARSNHFCTNFVSHQKKEPVDREKNTFFLFVVCCSLYQLLFLY